MCPVLRVSRREPVMAACVARPTRRGCPMSLVPQTISVGARSCAARGRKSCSPLAKLRHSAAPVDVPSRVRTRAVTRLMISRSLSLLGLTASRVKPGSSARVIAGVPMSCGERHDGACGMYQRSYAVLYPVKGTARNGHRRRPRGRGIMHPMFVKLFIETDADDLLAEEEVERRRARRSRRNRPAVAVRAASRDRNLRRDGDDRPSACPRLPGKHGRVPRRVLPLARPQVGTHVPGECRLDPGGGAGRILDRRRSCGKCGGRLAPGREQACPLGQQCPCGLAPRHAVPELVVHLERWPRCPAGVVRPSREPGKRPSQRPEHACHQPERGADECGELFVGLVGMGEEPVERLQQRLVAQVEHLRYRAGQRIADQRLRLGDVVLLRSDSATHDVSRF